MSASAGATTRRVRYGPQPQQFADLALPVGGGGPAPPVVVLVHGGFWKAGYGLDLMEPLVVDLVARGIAVWNVEYRRVGQPGGGYPGTLDDVAAAVDRLAAFDLRRDVDLDRVAFVGHSAGGHLALWAASRSRLRPTDVGASPAVTPVLVVGQAAVTDLVQAAVDGLGSDAVQRFIGSEPHDGSEAYRIAQPDIGVVPTLLVTGDHDDDVPAAYSRRYADRVDVVVVEGDDHFDVIDPASASWRTIVDALTAALRPGSARTRKTFR